MHNLGGYIQCVLIDSEKIGRLMMIICDPVALCLIFIRFVPIFYKIKQKQKNITLFPISTIHYTLHLHYFTPSIYTKLLPLSTLYYSHYLHYITPSIYIILLSLSTIYYSFYIPWITPFIYLILLPLSYPHYITPYI